MPRTILLLAIVFLVVPQLSGCLITHHRSRVVREDEGRMQVAFQSPAAESAVHEVAYNNSQRLASARGSVLAVPFLLWLSNDAVVSENAWYNDHVQRCDSNRDSLITENEARVFNPSFAQNWSPVEVARINNNEPAGSATVQNASHTPTGTGRVD